MKMFYEFHKIIKNWKFFSKFNRKVLEMCKSDNFLHVFEKYKQNYWYKNADSAFSIPIPQSFGSQLRRVQLYIIIDFIWLGKRYGFRSNSKVATPATKGVLTLVPVICVKKEVLFACPINCTFHCFRIDKEWK